MVLPHMSSICKKKSVLKLLDRTVYLWSCNRDRYFSEVPTPV
jgi:hypothetical protein